MTMVDLPFAVQLVDFEVQLVIDIRFNEWVCSIGRYTSAIV